MGHLKRLHHKSLVSLGARSFISKAIQPLSPKRVNLLISLPDFLLLHMQWNWENTLLGNVRREQVHMLKISVISYKSTNLRVHRSVSLKYRRFPDQHIKGIIDSLNRTRDTQQSFIRGVTATGMNPLIFYTCLCHFWLKRCPLSRTFL